MMRQRPKSGSCRVLECEPTVAGKASVSSSRSTKKPFLLKHVFPFANTKKKVVGQVSFLVVILSSFLKRQITVLWNIHDEMMRPIQVTFNNDDDTVASSLSRQQQQQQLTSDFFRLPRMKIPKKPPDYGGLSVQPLKKKLSSLSARSTGVYQRQILKDDAERYHQGRTRFLKDIDEKLDSALYHNEELDYPQRCIRPNWVWNYYPVCNNFHEMSIDESILGGSSSHHHSSSSSSTHTTSIRYLNHGASREAWLIEPARRRLKKNDDIVFPFVLKTMRTKYDYEARSLRRIHVEALILERLSASDRTTDIYGHCGSSTMVEQASEITELIVPDQERPQISKKALAKLQKDDVHPMNNYTAEEKLELALAMAEGIAELHGYEGGVIVNNDIHPEQWVRSKVDGKVKLNDFNNGFFLEWNPREKRYCSKYRSFGGDFHSPEEFRGDYVTEKIDVYSMGNNIHCLLTGLWQFPWLPEEHDVQPLVISGKRDHVDPRYRTRSLIEGRLVEIMEQAWIHDPAERASIFEVVEHLRETRRLHEQQKRATTQKR